MVGTDDGEGGEDDEHRYQERSSEIRLWRSGLANRRSKAHEMKRGNRATVALGSTQTRKMGNMCRSCLFSNEARRGVFIRTAVSIRDKYSTCEGK